MKEIKHIAIGQSAKVLAIIATLLSAIFVIPMTFYLMFLEGKGFQPQAFTLLLIPIFYGLGTYIVWAIIMWLYNWVAKRFGGIKLQIEE